MLAILIKSLGMVVCAILIRSALPRYRVDQILLLNWKIFIYYLIFFFCLIIFLDWFF